MERPDRNEGGVIMKTCDSVNQNMKCTEDNKGIMIGWEKKTQTFFAFKKESPLCHLQRKQQPAME